MRVLNRSGQGDRQAEKILGRYLDDRFTFAYHVGLPGYGRLDALLLGPQGLTVLAILQGPGRFRCLGENWYVLDEKTGQFRPQPSPIQQARDDMHALQLFLQGQQLDTLMPVDGALLAPGPNARVEFMQPALPVLAEAKIGEYAQKLAAQQELVDWMQVDQVLKSLGLAMRRKPWQASTGQGARPARAPARRVGGLSRRQIWVLVGIAIADLAVLAGGVAILLTR